MLQACIVYDYFHFPDEDVEEEERQRAAMSIYCMFKNRGALTIEALAEECAEENFQDEWPTIKTCEEGPEGQQAIERMAQLTHAEFGPDNCSDTELGCSINRELPIVKINGTEDQDAVNNLMGAICKLITVS